MIVNVLIFIAVLSLLVFFHELGHFAAAKMFGIYVKRFSIGMPPRIFGIQLGETDYCIGALPLGGFVMMAGQEDVPLSEEEREKEYGHVPEERWFNNRPVYQRICVLLAGPFMNFFLALLLYAIIGLVGSYVPEWEVEARVGEIEAASPAEDAPLFRMAGNERPDTDRNPDAVGWQVGDRILTINGRNVSNMTDLAIAAVLGGEGKQHDVVIERTDAAGNVLQYLSPIAPRPLDETGHARFGVGPFETAQIRKVRPDSAAAAAGLQEGDIIRSVDGKLITLSSFIKHIENTAEGNAVSIEILRNGHLITLAAQPKTIGRITDLSLGIDDNNQQMPVVLAIEPSLAEKTKLRLHDSIAEVNGKPVTLEELMAIQESSPETLLELKVQRPAVLFGLIESASVFIATVDVQAVRAIGVALEPRSVWQRIPVAQVIPNAFYQSYLAVERTIMTIVGLVAGAVSPKDLGGPVMIFDVTTKAAQAGWDWLVKITAFISVNLFILNLLPLPVLDGGQVVMNAVEAARGKPMNEKILERLQQVGIVMLIALMLFVTYNDIERIIRNMIP